MKGQEFRLARWRASSECPRLLVPTHFRSAKLKQRMGDSFDVCPELHRSKLFRTSCQRSIFYACMHVLRVYVVFYVRLNISCTYARIAVACSHSGGTIYKFFKGMWWSCYVIVVSDFPPPQCGTKLSEPAIYVILFVELSAAIQCNLWWIRII